MTSYPFLIDLNTAVLSASKGIQGRFHVSKKSGYEINSDVLGEVLKGATEQMKGQKYPLALMMPPSSTGVFTHKNGTWDTYRVTMFFLKTTYYDGRNQVADPNPIKTSKHTVPQDWHDMKRCAVSFIRSLDRLQRTRLELSSLFRLEAFDQMITPVSEIGVDRASGVRLDYRASLFIGCDNEDYESAGLNAIVIPVADSHPIHNNL